MNSYAMKHENLNPTSFNTWQIQALIEGIEQHFTDGGTYPDTLGGAPIFVLMPCLLLTLIA